MDFGRSTAGLIVRVNWLAFAVILVASVLIVGGSSRAGWFGTHRALLARSIPGITIAQALAALPSATPPPPATTTWYVNKATGSDSNNGTSSGSAFATIGKANTTMGGGDVVVIYPGTYPEDICVNSSGTASHYTTFIAAAGQARPVVSGHTLNGGCEGATFGIQVSYVRISGLAITRPVNNTSDATSSGIYIYSPSSSAPTANHHFMIDGNLIYNCASEGIGISHTDYAVITGNIIHDNANYDPDQSSGISFGFDTNYDSASGYHNYVTDNILYHNFNLVGLDGNPASSSNNTTDGEGIIFDTTQMNSYTGTTLVAGNLAFNNGGDGFLAFDSAYVDFINNTAFSNFNDTNNARYPGGNGDIFIDMADHINVTNNIAQSVNSSHQAINGYNGSTNITWNNNVTYIGGTSSDSTPISGSTNKLGVNPLFNNASVSTGVADFNLQRGSPAIGYGSANSFTYTDLNGASVPSGTTHNAGAY
jgi:hypothetical protein